MGTIEYKSNNSKPGKINKELILDLLCKNFYEKLDQELFVNNDPINIMHGTNFVNLSLVSNDHNCCPIKITIEEQASSINFHLYLEDCGPIFEENVDTFSDLELPLKNLNAILSNVIRKVDYTVNNKNLKTKYYYSVCSDEILNPGFYISGGGIYEIFVVFRKKVKSEYTFIPWIKV